MLKAHALLVPGSTARQRPAQPPTPCRISTHDLPLPAPLSRKSISLRALLRRASTLTCTHPRRHGRQPAPAPAATAPPAGPRSALRAVESGTASGVGRRACVTIRLRSACTSTALRSSFEDSTSASPFFSRVAACTRVRRETEFTSDCRLGATRLGALGSTHLFLRRLLQAVDAEALQLLDDLAVRCLSIALGRHGDTCLPVLCAVTARQRLELAAPRAGFAVLSVPGLTRPIPSARRADSRP
jgi:hypothetical protein